MARLRACQTVEVQRVVVAAVVATIVFHVVFAAALMGLARWLELELSTGMAAAVATLFAAAFRGRLALAQWDRRTSDARRLLLEEPYFVHWCGLGLAMPPFLTLLAVGISPLDAAAGAYLMGLTIAFYGVVVRRRLVRSIEVEVPVAGLPPAFDGYRIVQLSDLHVGSLCPPAHVARWIERAHALGPDLIVLTGDYVTMGPAYHRAVAEALAPLHAPDGVVAILGNHDYHDEGRALLEGLASAGIEVLRNARRPLLRDGATLSLVGLDDRFTGRFDPAPVTDGPPGEVVVALAHDPVDFDLLADLGADLVVSGHTHWGQLAIPGPFIERLNAAAPHSPRSVGLHRRGDATLWIHPGLGTTALPMRLGVAPAVVALVLRPISRAARA